MVSAQINQTIKGFEWKLDSVRKEREAAIKSIESIVKEVFEKNQTGQGGYSMVPVGIKQYGS